MDRRLRLNPRIWHGDGLFALLLDQLNQKTAQIEEMKKTIEEQEGIIRELKDEQTQE